ncbi:zinc metalloprotease [Rugosimonospora africana]|uniref:Zinc metalloprotease n=1 Tax=Rugosimonospora africana TaxID=556532 RepID=A0A8J3QTK0_9ACTN|nr:zinc metalloprotease [Rugosimonospora africana]
MGRIAGVKVGVNWSVLLIFALIASTLAGARFPATYPGNPEWAYAAAGVGAALVFFTGLLAHEVSHAIVARRNGIAVEGITLWLFGGVAQLRGEAAKPGAELRIAGVGPLVSLIIGLFFGGIAALLRVTGESGLPYGTFLWLGAINVALAVFNILPAAPLDGGRLLRAALWKRRGDRVWAAIVSARSGRVLGLILIALSVALFIRTRAFGQLWLALIGWFLFGAAAAEERQARLGALRVDAVMSANPETVAADLSVGEFINRYVPSHHHWAFPLTVDERPVGLVTLEQARQVPLEHRDSTTLRDVACPPSEVALAAPHEPLNQLLPRLSQCANGSALVVADQRLVGIVTPTDIARAAQAPLAAARR